MEWLSALELDANKINLACANLSLSIIITSFFCIWNPTAKLQATFRMCWNETIGKNKVLMKKPNLSGRMVYSAVLRVVHAWSLGSNPHQCFWTHDLQVYGSERSAAMLTSKQSAGVTAAMNLGITTGEKAGKQGIHPGFETHCRCHQKSKTGGISGPTKRTCVFQKIFEKKLLMRNCKALCWLSDIMWWVNRIFQPGWRLCWFLNRHHNRCGREICWVGFQIYPRCLDTYQCKMLRGALWIGWTKTSFLKTILSEYYSHILNCEYIFQYVVNILLTSNQLDKKRTWYMMVYCGWLRKPEFQRIVFVPDEFFVVQFELFLNFSFAVRLKNLKLVKHRLREFN